MTDNTRIEDILRQEGFYTSTTRGISMYPMLRDGRDTVIIRPPEGRLRKYDVPLYRVGPKYVLHRVIQVLPDGYVIWETTVCKRSVSVTRRSSACLPASTGMTARWTCPAPATGCTAGAGAPSPLSGGSIARHGARLPHCCAG